MAYIPLRKAVEFLGLHPNTLRRYADEGKIKSIKNEAGQRLYDVESYISGGSTTRTTTICYCRVSSSKQRDDLDRQVAYMESLYPNAEFIRDVGSGINFKRNVNEAYTSKTVSWTGEMVKIGGSKIIKSPTTGETMDRDLNGARGIFLRALVDTPWLRENLNLCIS
jgi:putative resolvase